MHVRGRVWACRRVRAHLVVLVVQRGAGERGERVRGVGGRQRRRAVGCGARAAHRALALRRALARARRRHARAALLRWKRTRVLLLLPTLIGPLEI